MLMEAPERELLQLYVTEGFYKRNRELVEGKREQSGCRFELFSDSVMAYASDTQHPQGALCVIRQKSWNEEEVLGGFEEKAPLLLALDNLQDPGNLGTVFRTGEAAGATGIIMGGDCVDVYNPKVIRSTMGSVFRMRFLYAEDLGQKLREMKERGIRVYGAHLAGALCYDEPDYRKPSAFLIGNEGKGLREDVARLADCYIKIPMFGQVESLNAAVAASVLSFEAARQRRH